MLDKWAYPNTQLYEHKNAFSPSFIACYTNISDVIDSPRLSKKAKSHLEHEAYLEELETINDLLSREKIHNDNDNVSKFMGSVRSEIDKSISNKD